MIKSSKLNGILNVIKRCLHIIFPLLTFPYLSRILGPENLGKFSYADSIINYFLLAAMLGVESYAVREGARFRDDKTKLYKFVSEVFTINIVSGIFVLGFFLLMIFSNQSLIEYRMLLLILGFMIPATILGRDYINVIYEDFLYITVRYIIIQLIALALIFILINESTDYVKYTIIFVLSYSLGYLINIFYTSKILPYKLSFNKDIKQHLIPIFILFCGQISTVIYIQSGITMLGIFKTESEVGIYTIASKIPLLTKSIVNALTAVTIPRIVYFLGHNELKNYENYTQRLFYYLFFAIAPIVTGLTLEAKYVLRIVGGTEYLSGTFSLQILSVMLIFAVFAGYFCNAILIPNRKEKDFLYITIFAAVINVALNLIFIPPLGILGTAISTLVSEVVVLIFAIIKSKWCRNF